MKNTQNKRACVGCGGLRDSDYAKENACICCGSFGVILPEEKIVKTKEKRTIKPTKRQRGVTAKKKIAGLFNN